MDLKNGVPFNGLLAVERPKLSSGRFLERLHAVLKDLSRTLQISALMHCVRQSSVNLEETRSWQASSLTQLPKRFR